MTVPQLKLSILSELSSMGALWVLIAKVARRFKSLCTKKQRNLSFCTTQRVFIFKNAGLNAVRVASLLLKPIHIFIFLSATVVGSAGIVLAFQ